MNIIAELLQNFFTHKDFLPPPSEWYGTVFSPLQIVFCVTVAAFIMFACRRCARKSEKELKRIFIVLWLIMCISEPIIGVYDCCAGKEIFIDWGSVLPLWHCSIFLFAAPFAVFSKGKARYAACGYICTLGLLGGVINFIYPATYLSCYSCISFAGFRTVFYHGAMVFVAVTMLLSGYHSFKGAERWQQLLLPIIPALIISIPANIVNFTMGTDYMFFKMESFFFAPIGYATPDWFTVILTYIILFIIHTVPYLPSFIKNRKQINTVTFEFTEGKEPVTV